MKPAIQILDQHSANQIAAGEVIERPVSVVKELIENALDAKAKRIDINIEKNGLPLIKVRDDGYGIRPEDLPLTILRHATNKIFSINDLNQLLTLGFRGEALPSIASVSHLEITSRPQDQISGTCLTLKGGRQPEIKEVGCPIGTTVAVRDLFFNTPARKKFLKTTNTEFGLISDIVGRLALARPEVAFTLTHPRQVVLQTSGQGSLLNTAGDILGINIARRLIPVSVNHGDWLLEGFISPPDLVRSSRQGETFIVNGRYIRSSFLSRVLLAGYHTLIPSKQYPIAIICLKLPPSDYDVNVHPTKMDIRFRDEKDLALFIQEEIKNTLIKNRSVKTLFLSVPSAPQVPKVYREKSPAKPITHEQLNTILNPNKYMPNNYQDTAPNLVREDKSGQDLSPFSEQKQDPPDLFAEEALSLGPLQKFRPLAQLFNTYILATDGQILLIIDQHAAHERLNFERLLKRAKENPSASQQLLIPIPLELTLQEEQALLEYLWALTDLGFILEHFGPRTYLLRGIPAYTGSISGEELLREFLEQILMKNHIPEIEQLLEEWIYLLACHESIKAKDNLSIVEMEQLISRLSQTGNPFTCPHGRPTMIQISAAELNKRFYRR
ncbi:MAG: DNA mismatch repair endonuclease MutL [Desulfitobacteriaceae bacterium]|nr:DNA mismatch repair endonuclease MutL [Desulfitobacteriaceae bacterium]MDD4346277.1 DNA mismatch repair endonuclease MutL [Desulfitobacteriaceae bacterium]MDD4400600.1 DNA mismatch repair endonuclease MutL [Desulfitobacteriaceae bacterium]